MCKISDRNDWADLWYADKQNMIDTMIKNMTADLNVGYDYFGNAIKNQQIEIDNYKKDFEYQVNQFTFMTDSEVNRWCFYDMKKRGVIE